MSALGHGRDLGALGHAVPPREQRILAPSLVDVNESNMGSKRCVCSLQITDVVNLVVYFVPMTPEMVDQLHAALDKAVGTTAANPTAKDNHK